jgi:HlyD family secretion protein
MAMEQAQARQSEAALQQSEIDLKHTEIKAPVDGTVVARRMDVGQTVAASFQAPTIFEIAQDLTKMQVDTSVDEAEVGKVRVGQQATFTVDAYMPQEFLGQVTQIRKAPINTANVITYDVIVTVPNPDLKLLPGMTATVKILVEKREDVLKVPSAALRVRLDDPKKSPSSGGSAAGAGRSAFPAGRGGDGSRSGRKSADAPGKQQQPSSTVYVLGGDGKPRPVKVRLGIGDGSFSAVESGELKEGDKVIVGVTSTKSPSARPSAGPGGPGGPGGRRMGF